MVSSTEKSPPRARPVSLMEHWQQVRQESPESETSRWFELRLSHADQKLKTLDELHKAITNRKTEADRNWTYDRNSLNYQQIQSKAIANLCSKLLEIINPPTKTTGRPVFAN